MSSYTLGKEKADLHLFTYKEGALSAFGHDLKLEIRDFQIKIDKSNGKWKIKVNIKKNSFYPVEPTSLSDSDRRDIQKNIIKHLPDDIKFDGELKFTNSQVIAEGELSIGRKYRTHITVPAQLKKDKLNGKVTIKHSYLGLKPFRAPLGLIKVKDEMLFTFTINISEISEISEIIRNNPK